MSASLPALTAEEFNAGCGYTFRGVPLCEDENGSYVFAYGHVPARSFLWAIADYDREECGEDTCVYEPGDVRHVWAITIQHALSADGWYIRWSHDSDGREINADTPNAFPVTVVNR